MIDRKKYKPVRSLTFKGKFLVGAIRLAFRFRRFLGGKDWESELPGHHEDPLHMRTRELLHLAHKYYFRIIHQAGKKSDLEKHFRENAGNLQVPEGFVPEHTLTLSAGGDLMPYDCINTNTCSSFWDECGGFFFGADLVTANLETPVNLNNKPSPVPEVMLKNMFFNGSNEIFDVFSGMGKYKGYQVLSVANNHSLDQGEAGLLQTLHFLDDKKVQYCGAAKLESLRDSFPIIEKDGIRVAFLAATFSLNALTNQPGKEWMVNHLQLNTEDPDIELLIHQSKLAREKNADFIVAHLHSGLAYQPYPSHRSVKTMHRICEQTGIDIVLGSHPHNPQPVEFFQFTDPFSHQPKQSFIGYSLGDFVAYDIFKWCHLPLMLKFTLGKSGQGTFITKLEMKLAYLQAIARKGKVEKLFLRDFNRLSKDTSSLDADLLKEFIELEQFARQFLLPGNVEKFLV